LTKGKFQNYQKNKDDRRTEWSKLNKTTLHLNGAEHRYFLQTKKTNKTGSHFQKIKC